MSDLTRPNRGEVLDRLTTKITDLPADDVAPYLLLVVGLLAKNAPDVLDFLMDRADQATSQ